MERSAEKDKFTEEYLNGLIDISDKDPNSMSNYNAIYDSKVRNLFGGWINFGKYQSDYQESKDEQEKIIFNSTSFIRGIEKKVVEEENFPKKNIVIINNIPSIKETLRDAGFDNSSNKLEKEAD